MMLCSNDYIFSPSNNPLPPFTCFPFFTEPAQIVQCFLNPFPCRVNESLCGKGPKCWRPPFRPFGVGFLDSQLPDLPCELFQEHFTWTGVLPFSSSQYSLGKSPLSREGAFPCPSEAFFPSSMDMLLTWRLQSSSGLAPPLFSGMIFATGVSFMSSSLHAVVHYNSSFVEIAFSSPPPYE